MEDNDEFYVAEESLFIHHSNEQIQVLDIIYTNAKDPRTLTAKNG